MNGASNWNEWRPLERERASREIEKIWVETTVQRNLALVMGKFTAQDV
jgi:hypothetical protein